MSGSDKRLLRVQEDAHLAPAERGTGNLEAGIGTSHALDSPLDRSAAHEAFDLTRRNLVPARY